VHARCRSNLLALLALKTPLDTVRVVCCRFIPSDASAGAVAAADDELAVRYASSIVVSVKLAEARQSVIAAGAAVGVAPPAPWSVFGWQPNARGNMGPDIVSLR
jgi:hypothetical protein